MTCARLAQLSRGNNRAYMLQKWGAIKPSDGEVERRWETPFNREVAVSWWEARAPHYRIVMNGSFVCWPSLKMGAPHLSECACISSRADGRASARVHPDPSAR